mgnify:FL=1
MPKKKQVTIKQVESKWKKVFSNGYDFGIANGFNNGFFMNSGSMFVNDPFLLNQRIKQLKTTSNYLDREHIENALLNPDNSEYELRTATHSMLNMTYPLYRLLMLYEGILTYRNYVYPKYVPRADMDTPRYKSDEKFMDMWLKKLNPPKQFRRMTEEIVSEGKRAYYIRQSYNTITGNEKCDYVHFEELPSDWVKIVKKSTDSYYIAAFNFAYFWQAGTSLGQFPPIFSEYYNELMSATILDNNKNVIAIDKTRTPEDVVIEYNSTTMKWFYWKELPADQCFVFSFDESHALHFSPFASLLLQAQDLNSYALLQQQLLSIPLYSIILGEIPLHDDKNNDGEPDDTRLSPDMQKLFESYINMCMPPGTTYAMTPSTNNTQYKFQEIPNADKIYNMGLEGMLDTSGANTIMTTNSKPSVAQSQAGKIVEVRYIDRIYDQYIHACNIILRNMYEKGDLKYEWRIRIFGDAFSDSDKEVSAKNDLSLGQKELFPEFLAYHNHTLNDAVDICNQVDASGIYQLFEVLLNSFTTPGTDTSDYPRKKSSNNIDNDKGRPPADLNNLQSENTAESINSGQNTSDMKTFMSKNTCLNCGKAIEIGKHFCGENCEEEYKENIIDNNE